MTGTVLDGRYELYDVVGEGAFGRVYRGRDRRLDRVVAVKVIKPWWAEDPPWADTFEREARLLARVSDPGIVQIFDVGQAREGLYYVAELVEGESLASRLEHGALGAREAGEIAEQLCRALASAHTQGIVHRDIKPANVLLSTKGQVKLGDFGVARLAEGSTSGTPGGVVGTPRYMAPEQARGRNTTPATDVYSAGVVLYEMLSGAPPFSGGSAVELALCHVQDPPPPLPADVPRPLAAVAARALAKDPAARYQDGRAMAAALAQARPAGFGGATPGSRARAPAHAHRLEPHGAPDPQGAPDPTRIAPKLTERRSFNPSARRRSIALIALVGLLLAGMILGAVLLAPPARVRVPRLTGLTRAAVVAKLRGMPLRTTFTRSFDSAPPGTAIGQRPSPGARIADGSTVRVVLSAGPPPVEVPRLVGQASTSARSILSSLGLTAAVTAVPAPGVAAGNVTAQSPAAGKYLRQHAPVALTVAATPQWRSLTSLSGTDGGQSAPFRIRGDRWRIDYRMAYVGTCTLIFFCDGPSARIVRAGGGAAVDGFGMSDGGPQSEVVRSGPGVYEIQVTPGSDTAQWSMQVEDYY
jgi:eukaryotic-like serine/threonine-protein kinase